MPNQCRTTSHPINCLPESRMATLERTGDALRISNRLEGQGRLAAILTAGQCCQTADGAAYPDAPPIPHAYLQRIRRLYPASHPSTATNSSRSALTLLYSVSGSSTASTALED